MICPIISTCKAKVNFDHYKEFCSNMREDKYKDCPHFKKQTEAERTPMEWSSILTRSPT